MIDDGDPPFRTFVAQILQVIKAGGNQGMVRYRVVLSDGLNFVQGMLATQLNHLVTDGQIADNVVIRINDFMVNLVQNRTVLVVLAVDVIDSQCGQKIGNPSVVEAGPSAKVETGGDVADGTQYTERRVSSNKRQRIERNVQTGLLRDLSDCVIVSIWEFVGGGVESLALLEDAHDRALVAWALEGKHRILLLAEHPTSSMRTVVQNLRGSKDELDLYCMRLHQLANTGLSVGAIAAIHNLY